MAKRGFFAEMQHQNQLAARRQAQAQRAQARAQEAARKQAEQARRHSERARQQLARASVAEQKAAEREAKVLHEEAQLADAAALNADLAAIADELDSILAATLDVDDFIDLETLRATVAHPPFGRTDLEATTPQAVPVSAPPQPVFSEPDAPTGLSGVFGKKKHAAALATAQAEHAAAHETWQKLAEDVPARQLKQSQEWESAERRRQDQLRRARESYRQECEARDAQVTAANQALDELMRGMRIGSEGAIQEYAGIVLANSVYPDVLSVGHEFAFDRDLEELTLTVLIASPEHLPPEKTYKFIKARDEITATLLPQKDLKARYASIVQQVALRTVHEVFEADRRGHVNTIALSVATEANDAATGLRKRTTLLAVAAERGEFLAFDLANIVPAATLQHLGASVSKSPYDLVAIDGKSGVRGR